MIQQIQAYYGHWTLEIVYEHGFVSKLDHINKTEPKISYELISACWRAAVYNALQFNHDVRVLEWWINDYYCCSRDRFDMADLFKFALCFKSLNVPKWIQHDNHGQLPQYTRTFTCSDSEIACWLYEHGCHLRIELPIYECSAAGIKLPVCQVVFDTTRYLQMQKAIGHSSDLCYRS